MVKNIKDALIGEITISLKSVINRDAYASIPSKEKKKAIKKILKRIIKQQIADNQPLEIA